MFTVISALDLFTIGIGPSSSHTVGPMKAAREFVIELASVGHLAETHRVRVDLFGSLAATGIGHGTDKAVTLGLEGDDPATVDPAGIDSRISEIDLTGAIALSGGYQIEFSRDSDIVMHRERRSDFHPNALTFHSYDKAGGVLHEVTYYSVGGGFIVDQRSIEAGPPKTAHLPYPFTTAGDLLRHANEQDIPISEIVRQNELALHTNDELDKRLTAIWDAMQSCIANGISSNESILPGGLNVRRRAPKLHTQLSSQADSDDLHILEWVNLFALAVNEENAAGNRVVTAPTNGAAGIIPAVLGYYVNFVKGSDDRGVRRFLLAASAVGILIKANASISGAEVGCQGEVGSACAMAAAGLTEVLGGTPPQVENAAEIALEHNLGLTCDPVAGLVQIPCIERNAIASVKAINAARLALHGDGVHRVSLDEAIETLRATGADMKTKYKETSRGGLAVSVANC